MKKVVELYKGILPAFGLSTDENDKILIGGGELKTNAAPTIEGKSIYLPTEEYLKNSEYRDQVAFHPLMENILKQPSQVLHVLQNALTNRLYACSSTIIKALLAACAKQKHGEEISSPRLLKYLSGNEAADEKTKKFFDDLCLMIETDKSKKIFSVYLKFGGKVNGVEVLRQCSITSPLLDALERAQALATAKSGPISVWGVEAPRKKDIELLINVIKSAFPLIEEKGYTKGSSNKIAPYCAALFESTLAFNEDVIEISKALAKQEPVTSLASYLLVDLTPLVEMLGTVDEWDIYRNSIMKTAYNEGEGWNTNVNATSAAPASDYKVVRETADKPDGVDAPANVAAITKTIVANQVKRVPGTRQPLVTLPEEEQGPLTRTPRSNYGGERPDERRGYERENYHGATSRFEERREGYDRRNPRDMTARELEDQAKWLRDEIIYIDRNGTREERDSIRDLEDDLAAVRRELDDRERPRGRDYEDRDRPRGRDYDDRDRDRPRDRHYGTQSSRPIPRVLENQRGGRRGERDEPRRRFADRY